MLLAWKLVLLSPLSSCISTQQWILRKGYRGRRRERLERGREQRVEKRIKEFHQSWLQCQSTWCGVQGLGGTHLDFVGKFIYKQIFFTLEISISHNMQISYHAHPIHLDIFKKPSLLVFSKVFFSLKIPPTFKDSMIPWHYAIMEKLFSHMCRQSTFCKDAKHFLSILEVSGYLSPSYNIYMHMSLCIFDIEVFL